MQGVHAMSEKEKKESLCPRAMTLSEFIMTGTWLRFTRIGLWLTFFGFFAMGVRAVANWHA
jgi:hypothetical protein